MYAREPKKQIPHLTGAFVEIWNARLLNSVILSFSHTFLHLIVSKLILFEIEINWGRPRSNRRSQQQQQRKRFVLIKP